MKKNRIFKVGDLVKVHSKSYTDFKDTDIEKELTVNYIYIVEEVGLGLGLVRLKGFIPLVRTEFLYKCHNHIDY